MHINSIISCANIMQSQIIQYEQAHVGRNKQQAAYSKHSQAIGKPSKPSVRITRQIAKPPIHDRDTMRHATHRPKFQFIYNTQTKTNKIKQNLAKIFV